MQAIAKGGLVHLRLHCVQHVGIGVANIADHRTATAIQIALAVNVIEVNTLGSVQHRTRQF